MDIGRGQLSICLLSVFIAISALQMGGAEEKQAGGPEFVWSLGLFRLATRFREKPSGDILKLGEVAVEYSAGFAQFSKLITEHTYREELIRCKDLYEKSPEADSLIDCKPLDQLLPTKKPHSRESIHSNSFVKRSSFSIEEANEMLPFFFAHQQEHHFHPFQTEHTKLKVDEIIMKHNITRSSLGFNTISPELGFFVTSKATVGEDDMTCTANVFLIVNQTEPVQLRDSSGPLDTILKLGRLLTEARKNGGLISIQSACVPNIPVGNLDTDFTLIYRKQFPFVSLSAKLKIGSLNDLTVESSISQKRNESSPDGYNTIFDIKSLSSLFSFMNFKLSHSVGNFDFTSGSSSMFLYHPLQSFVGDGEWDSKSASSYVRAYPSKIIEEVITGTGKALGEPNASLNYVDKPSQSMVYLILGLDRGILGTLLERFGLREREFSERTFHKIDFNSLPPDVQKSLEALIEYANARDEL